MKPPARSFAALLGGSRELAMFEAFALRPEIALSAADVSHFSHVTWATTHRRLNDWEAHGVVVGAGKAGKARLYRLNGDSPAIRALSHGISLAVSEILASELRREGVREPSEKRVDQVFELIDQDIEYLEWDEPNTAITNGVIAPESPSS